VNATLANRHYFRVPLATAARWANAARVKSGRARVPETARLLALKAQYLDAAVLTGRHVGYAELLVDLAWFDHLFSFDVIRPRDAFLLGRHVAVGE
jgi:hypothetical protein